MSEETEGATQYQPKDWYESMLLDRMKSFHETGQTLKAMMMQDKKIFKKLLPFWLNNQVAWGVLHTAWQEYLLFRDNQKMADVLSRIEQKSFMREAFERMNKDVDNRSK